MEVLFILLLFGTPIVLIMGWVRWFRREWYGVLVSETSAVGLALATVSVVLVLLLFLIFGLGRARLPDSSFTAIYRAGFCFSSASILCSILASLRRDPLRWHTLACAISTLLFWTIFFGVERLNAPTLSNYFPGTYHA